jgi:DNA topoisomerase-2
MKEQIQKITHVEHILKRPDSYVGPTARSPESYWVLQGDHFENTTLTYSPALLKIFDEILVNAIDRNSSFPDQVKYIKVLIDRETGAISVENNGPLGGISVEEHPTEKIWNPELTFGHLLTSTNYDDTKERLVGGRNGYGAKLANVYSKMFSVTIHDAEHKSTYNQKWENNMTLCHPPKITKYSKVGSDVTVSFIPDWERFGMTSLDQDFFNIIQKRVYDASFCTGSKCKVFFQGELVPKVTPEIYAKMYLPNCVNVATFSSDRWSVSVAPSDNGFQHVSFVNGICTTKGGTHVDYIASMISSGIIEELSKKIVLRPQQVRGTFFVMVSTTLVNPCFGSQVKSECTLKPQEFGSRFEPPKNFIKTILKTGIQDEVTALSKFKEQSELKKTDGARKSKITGIPKLDDANAAGTSKSHKCTLILTEGDSAKTLAVAGISVVGREFYGVFPLRGKCKNVRDASVKQLLANQEFNDLKKILGLQQGKVYTSLNELRYGRLMIMTDADNDGSHIKGLILNMIHYFWPSLLELNFVVSMVTPIIKATKGAQSMPFYTESAFRSWYQDGQPGWKIKYYKGLGTSTSLEARDYFKNIANLTVQFDMDPHAQTSIVLAFDKTKADDRKQWLLENSGRSDIEIEYGKISKLEITDFVHKDLVNFSLADLRRSIASVADGLKPSQRKVLYACFAKNLKDEMKVAQLAAYVAEKTSYHHGEVSLADTIVRLAHDFVGSNNINLLEPCGQFGTRLMGGKDASQTRYIFTKLTKNARILFDPKDDPVLEYLADDGKQIEPDFFVPVLPTVLVNGTEGIGTGFSCYVPPFNPKDIQDNILRIISGAQPNKMVPWFKNFKGVVRAEDHHTFVAEGFWEGSTIRELPPGRWTQDYKEFLDELVESKVISGYLNDSTTETVQFTIQGYTGSDFAKDLKLRKTFHTSNMHLFHPKTGIKRYDSAEEILVDFVELRVEYYKKRKANLIQELTMRNTLVENKVRFVQQVVNGDLIIFKRKKESIEQELGRKFVAIDGSYDYLLNIKTYQYTAESIKELNDEAVRIQRELDVMSKLHVMDMWKNDILKYNE